MCNSGQRGVLGGQVVGDLGGPGGLWDVGRRHPDRAHQAGVQVAKHVPLVAVHQVAAALAAVAHLRVLDGDPPVAGHALAQHRWLPVAQRHVLVTDLPGGGKRRIDPRDRRHRLPRHEPFDRLQEAEHHPQRPIAGGRVVPVAVQRRLRARPAKGWHARLGGHRRHPSSPRQPPPLLPRDDAQRLAQGVTQQVDGVLHPPRAPQWAGIQRRSQRPVAKPTVGLASATVCSTSRRSSPWAISRARKPTSVPLENGGWVASRQSNTSCQRRSITVASITSSSEAPV
jgi:hypothetical protein